MNFVDEPTLFDDTELNLDIHDPKSSQDLDIKVDPIPVVAISKKKRNGWACVARFGGVGDDLICASPLALLQKKFGHVEVLTHEPQGIVFENNPYVDKLSYVAKDSFPTDPAGYQAYWRTRSSEYDGCYILNHSCETTVALFPEQTHFWWPASFRRKFCGHNYLEVVHDICEVPHQFGPLFFPTDEEIDQAISTKKKVGEQCVIWVISGTRLDKLHPYSSEIVSQIIREIGPVIALGAPGKDFELAKTLQEDIRRVNGTDRGYHLGLSPDPTNESWPIRRVLTMARFGDVVIGPDTGPMWGIAFEETKKVMLLSHASEENITKHWVNTTTLHARQEQVPCWPCHQLHNKMDTCTYNREKTGAACISNIPVQSVIQATAKLY